jgi:hypothetical protein
VAQLSAAETVQKYQLGTSANVNRIKAALVNKEVLDITSQKIEIIDPLFKLWSERFTCDTDQPEKAKGRSVQLGRNPQLPQAF